MEEQYEDMSVGDKLYRYRFGNVFESSYIVEYEVVKVNTKTYRIKNISTGKDELVKKDKISSSGYEMFNQSKYDAIKKEKIIGMIEVIGYSIRYENQVSDALSNMTLDETVRYHQELKDWIDREVAIAKNSRRG